MRSICYAKDNLLLKLTLNTISNSTQMKQPALIFSFITMVPAVFTRTSCVTNVITLPSPACLLWIAVVIYTGPWAIGHVHVWVCARVWVLWGWALQGCYLSVRHFLYELPFPSWFTGFPAQIETRGCNCCLLVNLCLFFLYN